jgi:hypothetical protein
MAATCAHTDSGEPVAGSAGRYLEQHAMDLSVVLSMLDEMHCRTPES